jgi:hypothetical protein
MFCKITPLACTVVGMKLAEKPDVYSRNNEERSDVKRRLEEVLIGTKFSKQSLKLLGK